MFYKIYFVLVYILLPALVTYSVMPVFLRHCKLPYYIYVIKNYSIIKDCSRIKDPRVIKEVSIIKYYNEINDSIVIKDLSLI